MLHVGSIMIEADLVRAVELIEGEKVQAAICPFSATSACIARDVGLSGRRLSGTTVICSSATPISRSALPR